MISENQLRNFFSFFVFFSIQSRRLSLNHTHYENTSCRWFVLWLLILSLWSNEKCCGHYCAVVCHHHNLFKQVDWMQCGRRDRWPRWEGANSHYQQRGHGFTHDVCLLDIGYTAKPACFSTQGNPSPTSIVQYTSECFCRHTSMTAFWARAVTFTFTKHFLQIFAFNNQIY